MDWPVKTILVGVSLSGAVFGFFPVFSFSQISACPQKVASIEDARLCYFDFHKREGALEFVLKNAVTKDEKLEELDYFLTKVDPLSLVARETKLYLLLEEEDAAGVLREFKKIQRLDPVYFPLEKAASILVESKNFSTAKTILDELLRRQPGNLEARKLRAVALFELGEFKKSYEDLQFFAESGDKRDSAFRIASARNLVELKESEKARKILNSLSLEDLATKQLPAVAELAEKLREFSIARAAYRRLLQTNFEVKWVLKQSNLLQKSESLEENHDLLERAKTIFPDSVEIELARFNFNKSRGRLAKAGSDLELFLVKYPENSLAKDTFLSLRAEFIDKRALAQIEKVENLKSPSQKFASKEKIEIALPKDVKVATAEKVFSKKAPPSIKPGEDRALSSSKPEFKFLRVKKRETLMKFSFRVHGTHQRWKEIFNLNRDKLASPDHVRPGMKLKVRNEIRSEAAL